HHRAGSREEDVIEIHGSMRKVFCPKCRKEFTFAVTEDSLDCPNCDILLQPDIVLYGDSIPRLHDAIDLASQAEILLVVGTSFYTSTDTYVSESAKRAGTEVKIINENAEKELPNIIKDLID